MKSFVAFLLILTAAPSQGDAYTEAQLYEEFDARLLTDDEKRFLPAAPALSCGYTGHIDALGDVAARPRWNQPFVLEAIEAKGIVRFSNLVARKDMIRDLRSALHP